jgi:cysteine desulfurase
MSPASVLYADWNSTTPPSRAAMEAMHRVREEAWGNPSSIHAVGRQARRHVEDARELCARILRVSPRDVIFTCGATEANHLALEGASSLVVSALEHPSITEMAKRHGAEGKPVRFAQVQPNGQLDLESLHEVCRSLQSEGQLGARPVLTLQAVNQETGVLQPLEGARQLADEFGMELHVDAVQLLGRGPREALLLADSLSIASHKIRGPKGIGAYAYRCGKAPVPLARGGSQERGLRPGTQDAALCAGFGTALHELTELEDSFQRVAAERDWLEEQIRGLGGTIQGAEAPRLAHVSNFALPGWGGPELVAALDLVGICLSSGSACAAGTAEPSPVIEAMLGRDRARSSLRLSLGPGWLRADSERLALELRRLRG